MDFGGKHQKSYGADRGDPFYQTVRNASNESPHEQKMKLLDKSSPKKGGVWKTRGSFAQGTRKIDITKMG